MASSFGACALLSIKTFYIDQTPYTVKTMRTDGKFLYVGFEEIKDRNAAELLKNKAVFAFKDDIEIEENAYFIDDLIGCKAVTDEGNALGSISDIYQNGVSADVIEIKTDDGKTLVFPFIDALNLKYDADNAVVTVSAKTLKQVGMYEN